MASILLSIGTVLASLAAIVGAWLSQRAASKATKYNADALITNTKSNAELEAFQRARKMDVETIERQDAEIDEIRLNAQKLREKVRKLQLDNDQLHLENEALRRRVFALEQKEGILNEQQGL